MLIGYARVSTFGQNDWGRKDVKVSMYITLPGLRPSSPAGSYAGSTAWRRHCDDVEAGSACRFRNL